jgi:phage baseplate assembly protein W
MIARYRGWRFVVPATDSADLGAGMFVQPTGSIAMVEEDDAIRQALLLLISTRPGERVMRPAYGCDLERLIFSPNDDTTAGLAMHYVRQAVERWEPRVEILGVDAWRDPEDASTIQIVLDYQVRATLNKGQLVVPVGLEGERSP